MGEQRSNHVDKIEITIDGLSEKIAIEGFELVTKVNAIPEITIEALPIERPKNGVEASTAKYSEVTELYNKLSEKAKTFSTKATIKIKITSSEPEEKVQEETLKDWILTDVGLSTVTTYVAPTLTLVFKHRIVELDRFGAIYENVKNPNELEKFYLDVTDASAMDIMSEVYIEFAQENSVKFFEIAPLDDRGMESDYKEFCISIRKLLEEFHPLNYIDPKGGLFMAQDSNGAQLNVCKECLKSAIARLVTPHPFEVSTWNRIVNTICPVTLAQIVPKYYEDNLYLEPLAPWQECKFELDSRKIEAVDVCSTDPSPVIGVAGEKTFEHTQHVVYEANRIENPPDPDKPKCQTYAVYIPQKVLEETRPELKGHMEYFAENTIVWSSVLPDFGNLLGPTKIDEARNKILPENQANAEKAYAKTLYMTLYRKNCKASITSMPTFRDLHNKKLHPGRVLTARDKDTGLIFYGYISSMIIKGSTQGGGCSYYELTHVRPANPGPDNGVYIDELSEDTKNDCYEDYDYPVDE